MSVRGGRADSRRQRRGMWASKRVELPGDFKRRVREGGEDEKVLRLGTKMSLWERLGRWLGGKT